MVLWETQIVYKDKKTKKIGAKHLMMDPNAKQPQQDWDTMIRGLNKLLGRKCDPDDKMSVYFYDGVPECLNAVIAYSSRDASLEYCFDFIKETLEKGLSLEKYSPEERLEIDYDYMHLFSVKSEEITKNENSKRLYARLLCAVETMQHYRINITQSITSNEKVLYVTYKYPSSQYGYFENLFSAWEDITYLLERKPWWPKYKIDELEEELRAKVTGENDAAFSEALNDNE